MKDAKIYMNCIHEPLFEDKVAVAPHMRYSDETKRTWLETIWDYLISKAFEMGWLLK